MTCVIDQYGDAARIETCPDDIAPACSRRIGRPVVPMSLGQQYGYWTVIGSPVVISATPNQPSRSVVQCRCVCGTTRDVGASRLRQGKSLSCGCHQKDSYVPKPGHRFGQWTVVEERDRVAWADRNPRSFLCRCDCGSSAVVALPLLSSRSSTRCDTCARRSSNDAKRHRNDVIVGATFGRLTVLREEPVIRRNQQWRRRFLCSCTCGTEKVVSYTNLTTKQVSSCGCLAREMARTRMVRLHDGKYHKTHGRSKEPEYYVWKAAVARCTKPHNPGYRDYGGRGISVCAEWAESYEQFIRDVGPRPSSRHSLDRIDVNGNYEPGNVRWATGEEQAYNKRNSPKATFKGTTKTVGQWAYELRIDINRIKANLSRGLTPYESVFLGYPRTRARREKLGWGKQPGDVAVENTVPPPPLAGTCAESALPCATA